MSNSNTGSVSNLLAKARQGDPQAANELFERCRNYLAVVARSQVESWMRAKVDASDIVQETLLEAHRDFDRFRGLSEAEWLAWLRRILARNTADFVRRYRGTNKRQQRLEVPLPEQADLSSACGPRELADNKGESPTQEIMRLEREILMADAITRLEPDHQEVIVLRNLQRLPFDDVAKQMKRSRPAAQMLWMRAMKKLQEELKHSE